MAGAGERVPGAHDRHARLVADLRRAVLESPGVTDQATRVAAAAGSGLDEPWTSYVALVREGAYRITDEDITVLRESGRSEDEIFEVTIAAALGAGMHRLDAALRTLRAGA